MCENQLQYIEKIEFSGRLWGIEQIVSPLLVTRTADPSPTVSPWLDEPDSPTLDEPDSPTTFYWTRQKHMCTQVPLPHACVSRCLMQYCM